MCIFLAGRRREVGGARGGIGDEDDMMSAIGRPKTSGDRTEDDMKARAKRLAVSSKDPIEKLRYHCLARGNTGILSLGR